MKNIFKIKIHFFFYLIFILSFFTGNFKMFINLTLITFFHELGHILAGTIFKWKIEKIVILPISLLTIFNTKINNKKYEEIIVTIIGPLFQVILFLFIKDIELIKYNIIILLFNLLPISSLDGNKLLKILLYDILPFIVVEYIGIIISFITIIVLFIYSKYNLIVTIICVIYLFKTLREIDNIKYLYNKFIFERYLYKLNYSKKKNVNNKRYMYKNFSNTIYTKKYIQSEEEMLSKMFDNKELL